VKYGYRRGKSSATVRAQPRPLTRSGLLLWADSRSFVFLVATGSLGIATSASSPSKRRPRVRAALPRHVPEQHAARTAHCSHTFVASFARQTDPNGEMSESEHARKLSWHGDAEIGLARSR